MRKKFYSILFDRGKMLLVLFLVCCLNAAAIKTEAQQSEIRINSKNEKITEVFKSIQKQSEYKFLFSNELIKNVKPITVQVSSKNIYEIMQTCLKDSDLDFEVRNDLIVIKSRVATQNDVKVIKGRVTDTGKNGLPGVTVRIGGTGMGVTTDADGYFEISVSSQVGKTLIFSYIGMETVEKAISNVDGVLNVVMEEATSELEGVVVTGFIDRNKESFTGAVKVMKGDDLRQISTTNVFSALSIMDPSISIQPNNAQGSNPNALPEIIIRGTSSLNANQTVGVNSPLIVIDGVESTISDLYDMDIFDIETVTTLKDASATALYGEQAANGVIVVTRKRNYQKEVRLGYNFTGKIEMPDLSDYDLMDAREKLDFELQSGLYGTKGATGYTGEDYVNVYLPKLANVNSGINTDWLSKPLRNAFSHSHSLNISGEGSGLSYQVTANYGMTHGVMKDDKRERIGFGVFFSYNLKQKFIATLRGNFSKNNTKDSKYGSFSSYALANPYDSPYDEFGELRTQLSYGVNNPLYEASLSSFATSKDKAYSVNLNLRWNIMQGLYMTAFGSLVSTDSKSDTYISPLSNTFSTITDAATKGTYTVSSSEAIEYNGKFTANYNKNLDSKGSMFTVSLGGEIGRDRTSPYIFTAQGFMNDKLTDITFASSYPASSRPSGTSSESAKVAFVGMANIIYRGRYFIDGSFRSSGSSKFGKDQRFEPYWSTGIGWNLHRESWFGNSGKVNLLRLRLSYGHTGSLNFESYQAITTYRYDSNLIMKAGLGANPITLGNPDLKAQVTKDINAGLTSSLLGERLDINFDYYKKRTVDMVVPVSMPLSSGVSQINENVGEQLNKGFELSLSGVLIRNDDFYWRVSANAAKNYNELVKIGNVLKMRNSSYAAIQGSSPTQLYYEGKSTTAIYVVRSLGIDPADGQEIFLDKDGQVTKTYNPEDKVAVGDTEPKLRGSISTMFRWKNLGFNMNMQYSMGGYVYNDTRASKIEQINAKYNADRRAYTKRWEKPGDVVEYVSKKSDGTGTIDVVHSERFVEKENYLSIPAMSFFYEFDREKIKKYGFNSLSLNLAFNEIGYFSTVKRERGTSYPFARNVSLTISTRF